MADVRYEDAYALARHLIERSVTRATGEAEPLSVYDRPRQKYFVGALATPIDLARPGAEFISRLSPSAHGIDVLMEADGPSPTLVIQPRLSVYYRILPTYEQQTSTPAGTGVDDEEDLAAQAETEDAGDDDELTGEAPRTAQTGPPGGRRRREPSRMLVQVFRKVELEVAPIRVAFTPNPGRSRKLTDDAAVQAVFEQAFDQVVARLVADPERYRGPDKEDRPTGLKVPESALKDPEAFRTWLLAQPVCDVLPRWQANLTVEERPGPGGRCRLTVKLQNTGTDDRLSQVTDHYLFNCRLELTAEDARFRPFTFHTLPKDYRYDRNLWGYGQNCSADPPDNPEDARRLVTTTAPMYFQEKYVTAERVKARFADLAVDPIPVLRTIEEKMLAYQADWERHIADIEHSGREDAETLAARRSDLAGFRDEIARFREGIRALERYPKLMESFRLMNRVFANAGAPKGYDAWRLFQIVFIVMLIPDVASREPDCQADYPLSRLETVDVLWFPTGGGKTESYLGITVFAAFFDRLRGKHAGVTAWTRFPLRLLSLQQLQRIADVIGQAELVRRTLPGAERMDPFSVGYLVGQGNTPNILKSYDVDLLPEFKANPDRMQKYRIVSRCPFCGSKAVKMVLDEERIRLNHVCMNKDCPETVLPVYVVDNEIYRYLPTVIVGTIDKLAAVGNQRKFSQLFGAVDRYCPLHGYGLGECTQKYGCPKGTPWSPAQLYDPAPTLQIQDELHLLRESLGTFNGHYETWVDQFQQELTQGTRQKILAATATIENYEHQVRHLYLRPNPRRYPQPGKELGESFYAETKQRVYRRLFVGIMPYNKTHINAIIDLLLFFHEEIQTLRLMPPAEAIRRAGLPNLSPDAFEELLTQYDTSLTYVSAMKEGDRLSQSVEGQLSDYLTAKGMERINNVELTGHTQFDEVSDILDRLEKPQADWRTRIHSVVATSMISHGVDVARFNFMVFFGMPRQTAEYIQSSSRVGRTHVGVVFVCFNPNRARDQSHYHFFRKYHEYLDRLVEPVPINRWSKFSMKKTLPGLFAGYWLNRVYPQHFRAVGGSPYFSEQLRKAILNSVLREDETVAFLSRVYGVDETEGAEFGQELRNRVADIIRAAMNPRSEMFSESMNPKPMRSLREVDTPLTLRPDDNSWELWRRLQNRKPQEAGR